MTLLLSFPRSPDLTPSGAGVSVSASESRTPMKVALLLAILAHVVALYLSLPATKRVLPQPLEEPPHHLVPFVLPPPPEPTPPVRPPERSPLPTLALLPIPDVTPEELEPIRETVADPSSSEPSSETPSIHLPATADLDIPTMPDRHLPLMPGANGVSPPVRIKKVDPIYPQMARQAGIAARVHLRAVISVDGRIIDLEILTCTAPNLGFEEAAMDAVRQWQYQPGEQNGRPINVYFSIEVRFTLH